MGDEYKRLRKLLVRSWLAMVLIIVGLAFWGSYELKNLNQTIALQGAKLADIPTIETKGSQGPAGKDGLSVVGPVGPSGQGQAGATGKDGASVTPEQIAQAVTDYLRLNPIATIKGDQGADGREVELRVNVDTKLLEFRYTGSSIWQLVDGQDDAGH